MATTEPLSKTTRVKNMTTCQMPDQILLKHNLQADNTVVVSTGLRSQHQMLTMYQHSPRHSIRPSTLDTFRRLKLHQAFSSHCYC
jgi:hypothetical protein